MLGGAMVLTVAMILVKVIGMLYKLPLANAYNMAGKAYFSDAYGIYLPIYTIAISGLPVAVSRMVSQRVAQGLFRDVREIHKVAKRLFWIVGVAGTLLVLAAAYPYAKYVGSMGSLQSIIAIAPTVFFCCAMSAYRGYYEGLRNMVPTAISQVLEALIKLIAGLALAMFVMHTGTNEFQRYGTVFGTPAATEGAALEMIYPWASAASILGITLSTVVSLLFLVIWNKIRGDSLTKDQMLLAPEPQTRKSLRSEMIHLAIPVVISSAVLSLTNMIDVVNVRSILNRTVEQHSGVINQIYGAAFAYAKTEPGGRADYIWGVYNTALDFRTLIPTIVMALGTAALPAIAAAWTLRQKDVVQKHINTVLRMAMMLALPAGFGLAVLSNEIMVLFYEGQEKNRGMAEHAAPMLMMYGIFAALMAISGPIISMLQGIGRTDIPVKSLIAGAVVKIAANTILVGIPEVNVNGAVIGTVLFYAVIVTINLISLLRVSKTKLKVISVFGKPLFCALLSTAAAWLGKSLVSRFGSQFIESERLLMLAAVVAAILLAVLVYGISMLFSRAITKDDLENMPKGKKIGKVLAKYGLLG